MPIVKVDGKIQEYDDSRRARRERGEPRKKEETITDRLAQGAIRAATAFAPGLNPAFQQGALSNFADEISGGVGGVATALTGGSFSEGYTRTRNARRQADRIYQEAMPYDAAAMELAGAVASPIGRTGTTARVASRIAPNAVRVGSASRVGQALARSPVAQAAAIGAKQGALNAAGAADELEDVPGSLALGGALGGVLGGAAGAAAQGVRRGVQTLRDRGAGAADRVAYSKINQRLDNGDYTPESAADEIATRNAAGNDMRTMDLTPSTRADAAYYARQPNNRGSNTLQNLGSSRMSNRANRVRGEIEEGGYSSRLGTEADETINDIVNAQRAQGKIDYAEGGPLDQRVKWSNDLDTFFANPTDDTLSVVQRARNEITNRRGADLKPGNPDDHIYNNKDTGELTIVPTWRTFDQIGRAYRGAINESMDAGRSTSMTQRLQQEYSTFKRLFEEANQNEPYVKILADQRTAFERQEAVRLGEKLLALEPRKALRQISTFKEHQQDEARTGILSYLVSLKGNSLGKLQGMLQNDRQRKLLGFALGGGKNLAKFEQFVQAEMKSALADANVAGRQSITSAVDLAGKADEGGDLAELMSSGLRGAAFGGPVGGATGITRVLERLRHTMSQPAQEAYSRILAGTGEDIPAGVSLAKAYEAARQRSNMKAAQTAGRLVQQPFTTQAGD
jgi:hypothetical protein